MEIYGFFYFLWAEGIRPYFLIMAIAKQDIYKYYDLVENDSMKYIYLKKKNLHLAFKQWLKFKLCFLYCVIFFEIPLVKFRQRRQHLEFYIMQLQHVSKDFLTKSKTLGFSRVKQSFP